MINFGAVPLGSVLPIPFAAYAAATGASVTLTGLAVTDIEVYKGTSMTQRASDNGYVLLDTDGIDIDGVTGIHGFSIDTGDNSDASFYAAGSFYSVVVSAVTIDSQTVNFIAATFRLAAAETVAGVPNVNTTHITATAQTARDIGASVLLSPGTGTGQLSITTGVVNANAVQISGDSTAADNLETAFDDTAGAVPWQGIIDQGTAQGATATTLQLRAAAAFANDEILGAVILITGGSAGVWQSRTITDYVSSTDTATVDAWATTPSGTITYKILAAPPGDSTALAIKAVTDKLNTTLTAATGSPGEYQFTSDALELAPTGGGGSGPSAAAIADAVWDEVLSGHAGVGSTGAALAAAGGSGDPWATALPGAYGSGTAGKIIGDSLDAVLSTRASQTSVNTLAGYVDTEVAAIKVATDRLLTMMEPAGGSPGEFKLTADALRAVIGIVPTAIENADALLNRDMAAGTDTNARSPRNALRFLRNKWSITGTTLTVTKEDDTAAAWTSTVATSAGADPVVGNDPA